MGGSRRFVLALVLVYAGWVVARAWLSDDAYITFRVLDHFHQGLGLRWNPAERVQAFTHPLWAALVAVFSAPTGEFFFTTLFVSLLCSVGAVSILALGIARTPQAALVVLAPVLLSTAFVDYSTSGLENPLTHLLLAVFFLLFFRSSESSRDVFWLTLAASGVLLTRLDAGLLVLPALFLALVSSGLRKTWVAVLLGGLPVVAWEFFSLVYYGFLFPNTAYAKLGTGIASSELVRQGFFYLGDSLVRDPVTLVTVAFALLSAAWYPDRKRWALALGIGLELVYVVTIGGDFMTGRFLTAAFFASVILLARFPSSTGWWGVGLAWGLAAALVLLADPRPTQRPHGIADERSFYAPHTHLLPVLRGEVRVEDHPFAKRGQEARETQLGHGGSEAIGLAGFYAGPAVHIVDTVGLADPLLARLPMKPGPWRVGHFERELPAGYVACLRTGTNQIEDPDLARYYEALVLATRGSLLDGERWRAIGRLHSSWGRERLEAWQRRRESSETAPTRVSR